MPEITVTLEPGGGARVSLVSGPEPEVRDSVGLDELEACGAIPALENLVLDFDHYGRLVALRVLSGVGSALSPSLLEHPGATGSTGSTEATGAPEATGATGATGATEALRPSL